MSNTNTGGPAFPVFPETSGGHAAAFHGLTMRDYFAAKAMQGMLAAPENLPILELTDYAYQIADAMLKAREAA